jgi:hypothetical protein
MLSPIVLVDTNLLLEPTYIGDDLGYLVLSHFRDRKHIPEAPVMGADPLLNRQVKAVIAMVAWRINAPEQRGPLVCPFGRHAMTRCAVGVEQGFSRREWARDRGF